jgi:tryptophan synthase alpha chain
MEIKELLQAETRGTLNIFFTAGYPQLDSTVQVARLLDQAGIKMIEIGMPFSDPLADGETIQGSSAAALTNGMNIDLMFTQIEEISSSTNVAINLMGYFNQLLSVGVELFLEKCQAAGVRGLIIPDLPLEIYELEYQSLFAEYKIAISFLITPRTNFSRVKLADRLSTGFLYLVSDNSITGVASGIFSEEQIAYFKRIRSYRLKSPQLIGFGIKTSGQYELTKKYAHGAIIGSEFIRMLSTTQEVNQESIERFVSSIVST